jgi:PPOX class probable F420-dependent enzyme
MVAIPESHQDLLTRPVVVSLVTIMPDGQPQATPVWADLDNGHIVVNSAKGRQKDRNMQQGAKVTVLAIDPENPYRWMEVRGEVAEVDEESGHAWINRLAKKYRGVDEYYSGNMAAMRGKEQRVTYRIQPTKVNVG